MWSGQAPALPACGAGNLKDQELAVRTRMPSARGARLDDSSATYLALIDLRDG